MRIKAVSEEKVCSHLGEMVELEAVRKISDRYSMHGSIPADTLERALSDVEWDIEDFERSPTGPSTRNALVLGLVRRVCVDRLRGVARRINAAIESGADLPVDSLRAS